MPRRGFTLLEILAGLAVLALLSAGLTPLLTGVAVSDRRLRDQARAWEYLRAGLTGRYLEPYDAAPAEAPTGLRLETDTGAAAAWAVYTVSPDSAGTTPPLLQVWLCGAASPRSTP